MQLFAGGMAHVFVGVLQVFATVVQALSVLDTQVSWGWLQMLSVPLQVCVAKTQVSCGLVHFQ
jgi:hypothetical protein